MEALKPPLDVAAVFQCKGRLPVKGTINGFPFHGSLMNMGEGHMMVANAHLRDGAKCKAGDVVTVVMELDKDTRRVELPGYLKKIIASDPKAGEFWPKAPLHSAEGICAGDRGRQNTTETREKRIVVMMHSLLKEQRKK